MHGKTWNRRGAIAAAGAVLAAPGASLAAPAPTVRDVLERMRGQTGTAWFDGGVDHIVAGSADAPVTGIATVMMATFDALKSAVARGLNFVITHEPTFWSHPDHVEQLQDDPLYRRKLAYIGEHGLTIFHLHDHWHGKKPVDGINAGMMRKMGWQPYMDAQNNRIFNLPQTTLASLVDRFRSTLGDRTLRVIGDPALAVHRVIASWGNCSSFPGIPYLDLADVLVIGEAQDWDLIAYANDLVVAGRPKALVLLGHVLSEQWGMEYCADWLKTFVPEVPVRFLPIVQPYWNPADPVFEIDTKI
ncbi:MAG TPA: Nif3-like dinuclear metal center hexameric protein [Rhizomicrobium sp.]|jgi:putative NIF3 family GTP cyclohydrolase 1 type 2|nr:Nif3-like dinuclear metal center hexameric protein [Rhizomicrobium sp.]